MTTATDHASETPLHRAIRRIADPGRVARTTINPDPVTDALALDIAAEQVYTLALDVEAAAKYRSQELNPGPGHLAYRDGVTAGELRALADTIRAKSMRPFVPGNPTKHASELAVANAPERTAQELTLLIAALQKLLDHRNVGWPHAQGALVRLRQEARTYLRAAGGLAALQAVEEDLARLERKASKKG
jgi:hypothetical protein